MSEKIFLATDHAGFEHKEALKAHLLESGHEVVDCGAETYDAQDDYPDFISKAAAEVSKDQSAKAVIFGGSGQGEAIVANKFAGVRATVYYGSESEIIEKSRDHNDANVLSIGARFVSKEDLLKVVDSWLATPFSQDERHVRRIKKIADYE